MFSSDGCTATLAACDLQKINDYIDQRLSPVSQRLKEKLFAATIVVDAKLPATVVALDSLVTLREESTRVTTQLRLVEPDKASPEDYRFSVFSPIGSALIGLCRGDTIVWQVSERVQRKLTILEVE